MQTTYNHTVQHSQNYDANHVQPYNTTQYNTVSNVASSHYITDLNHCYVLLGIGLEDDAFKKAHRSRRVDVDASKRSAARRCFGQGAARFRESRHLIVASWTKASQNISLQSALQHGASVLTYTGAGYLR